jgi:RNA polymerase sigma factor (sigma-70 family)
MPTDEELMTAWCADDLAAGEALVGRMFEPIRRFFASKVGGEVEELLQQTFSRIVEGRHRFAGRSSARAYFYGVARNVLREHYRGRSRGFDDIEDASVCDLGAGASTLRWRRKEDELLLAALRTLPLRNQIVLELFFWSDLTMREISDVLDIPEGTVASRIGRAKARLRAVFEGHPLPPDEDDEPGLDATLDAWSERMRAAVEQGPGAPQGE